MIIDRWIFIKIATIELAEKKKDEEFSFELV